MAAKLVLKLAKDTEFGKQFDFKQIKNYNHFKEQFRYKIMKV
jgi:hypothetical protein